MAADLHDTIEQHLAGVKIMLAAVRVRMSLRGLPDNLGSSRTQNLVMIVREAVTNAVKHGKAKTIAIVCDPVENGFVLRILNDGEPFDRSTALGPETGHYGLAGMEERAKRGNFKLSFGSDGKWTQVKLEVAT